MGPGHVIGRAIVMRCLRCGNEGQRPVEHLKAKYGATSLADVARRARCLAYIKGVRCNGLARVRFESIRTESKPYWDAEVKHADP